jgi:hypothetical protein
MPVAARPAENIAAADDHADFRAGFLGLDDFLGQAVDDVRIDAVITVAHQCLTGKFQQDAAVFQGWHNRLRVGVNGFILT